MNESEQEINQNTSGIEFTEFPLKDEISASTKKEKPIQTNTLTKMTGIKLAIFQIRAIFLKTISFQSRQTSTNVFQLLIPFMCFALMWIANYQMLLNFDQDIEFKGIGQIPFLFNLPSVISQDSSLNPVYISDCNKWFLVKDNSFPPREKDTSKSLIKSLFPQICGRTQRESPYSNSTTEDLNTVLFNILLEIDKNPMSFGEEIKDLDMLPDGAFEFQRIDNNQIDVTIHVNDLLFQEFHRNNGLSKFSFRLPKFQVNLFDDVKNSVQDLNNFATNKTLLNITSEILTIANSTNGTTFYDKAKEKIQNSGNAFQKYLANPSISLPVIL